MYLCIGGVLADTKRDPPYNYGEQTQSSHSEEEGNIILYYTVTNRSFKKREKGIDEAAAAASHFLFIITNELRGD